MAGATDEQPLLAFEQEPPDGVLVLGVGRPVLLDRVIRPSLAHRALRNVLFSTPCTWERLSRASIADKAPGASRTDDNHPLVRSAWGSSGARQAVPHHSAEMLDQRGHLGGQALEGRFAPVTALVHVERAVDLDLQGMPAALR